MTMTIEIPDDLAARVTAAGLPVAELNRFAVAGIAAAIEETRSTPLPWEDFFAAMIEGIDPDQPPLSDYAISREGIYEDHP